MVQTNIEYLCPERNSGSIPHNFPAAFLPIMPMSAHSIYNPSHHCIRGSSYNFFHDQFNLWNWPVARDNHKSSYLDPQIDINCMTDSWPYPSAREIWDRLDNTFSNEDNYKDLRIHDFVVSGHLMA